MCAEKTIRTDSRINQKDKQHENKPEKTAEQLAIEALASKASRGDREALLSLCRAIAKNILFRVSCKVSNRMDAEDTAQEILIRVCANIHSLKDPEAFVHLPMLSNPAAVPSEVHDLAEHPCLCGLRATELLLAQPPP